MANTAFKQVDLFGGAIVASIPSTFEDVSDIRQVPDNQEVYLDKDGFSSTVPSIYPNFVMMVVDSIFAGIVFDILERVEKDSDIEALK